MLSQANSLHIPLLDQSVHCVVTSPPYWSLRDYGLPMTEWPTVTYMPMAGLEPVTVEHWQGCLGLEPTPEMYVAHLVAIMREVWRVLRDDGTLWLNLGDSYATSQAGNTTWGDGVGSNRYYQDGSIGLVKRKIPSSLKPKDLCGIPWRVAFALQADGWYLRSDIIWAKPNPMPESVRDRPTKAHEYLFLLAKSRRYYYDAEAIKEPAEWNRWGKQTIGKDYRRIKPIDMNSLEERRNNGRNRRTVWTIPTQPYSGAHFATFPPALIQPCVLAGCPADGITLDPFCGSGTVGYVCRTLPDPRQFIGLDLSRAYLHDLALTRSEFKTSTAALKELPLFSEIGLCS